MVTHLPLAQPLFSFARIRYDGHLPDYFMIILFGLTLFIAYFSWRFVETPFRNRQKVSRRSIFLLSGISALFFLSVGFLGHIYNGFAFDEKKEKVEISVDLLNGGDTNIYVVGDSHAEHLVHGLSSLNDKPIVKMTGGGCIPFRNVDRYDNRFKRGACAKKINGYLDALSKVSQPSTVILSSMGPVYLDGKTFNGKDTDRIRGLGVELITDRAVTNHYEVWEIGMRQTLKELSSNPKLKIIFAMDVPELGIDHGCQPSRKKISFRSFEMNDLLSSVSVANCKVERARYDERTKAYKALVYDVLDEFPKVYLFDPTPHFCDDDWCHGFLNDFGLLYHDADHLSFAGSLYYAHKVFGSFDFVDDE